MIRAISFGASTAQGARDTEGGGFIVRIGKRLEQENRGSSENFGIGGHTTDDMISRLPAIPIQSELDIVICTLGINDVPRSPDAKPKNRVSIDRHDSNVHQILENLKERCQVLYATQYPVDYVGRGLDKDLVSSYVNVGRQVAHEVGVEILDIHNEIDDEKYAAFIYEDGMHFNSAGHAYIADRIWDVLFADSAEK
jgi:lysophospholipase L1-like esterase